VFLVPETYHPLYVTLALFEMLSSPLRPIRLLKRKAIKLRKETGDQRYIAPMEKTDKSVIQTVLRSCYRPLLLLTLEPMCLNLCLYSAILLGILYLFFGAFSIVFSTIYGFELWQVGCSFMGILVGMILAISLDPLWRKNYARLERNHEKMVGETDESMPEWRLPPGKLASWLSVFSSKYELTDTAIAGAPLVTIGIFIFAWTSYPHVHWIAPIIGTAVFGMG
jgi:hypothetical protein